MLVTARRVRIAEEIVASPHCMAPKEGANTFCRPAMRSYANDDNHMRASARKSPTRSYKSLIMHRL